MKKHIYSEVCGEAKSIKALYPLLFISINFAGVLVVVQDSCLE